jgi:hypothetical protein
LFGAVVLISGAEMHELAEQSDLDCLFHCRAKLGHKAISLHFSKQPEAASKPLLLYTLPGVDREIFVIV